MRERVTGTGQRRSSVRAAHSCVVAACVVVCALTVAAGTAGAAAAPSPSPNPTTGTVAWSVRPAPKAQVPARPNYSFDLKPGAVVEDSIRVRNFGDAPLTFEIYASDAFNTRSGTLDLLAAGKRPKGVGAWISMSVGTIVVGGHASIDVPFRLAVPKDASPGDHTGGIVTSLAADGTDASGNPVRVDRRLGSRVYVRVDGPLRPGLEVVKTSAAYDGTLNPFGAGEVKVTYTAKNTGNVRVKARQRIEVEGILGLGGTTASLPDMPELLPGNSLTFVAAVPGVRPVGPLDATVTATPYASSDADVFRRAPDAAIGSASTWAIPWSFLVLVVIVAGAVVAVVRLRRQNRRAVEAEVNRAVEAALAERRERVSVDE